jgi:hypothetical protein
MSNNAGKLYLRQVVETETRRALSRIDIRPSDGMIAAIDLDHTTEKVPCRIYDYSITGICICLPNSFRQLLEQKRIYNLTLRCAWGPRLMGAYTVLWQTPGSDSIRLGMRLVKPLQLVGYATKPAKKPLIEFSPDYPMAGYLYKDHFYSERVIFKVAQISREIVRFVIAETDLLLYVGLEVDLIFATQSSEGSVISATVLHINAVDNTGIVVDALIRTLPKKLESDVVNHLLQNHLNTPENIRDSGFTVLKIANNFRFRFLKTKEEYLEVLKLRKEAYAGAGKVNDATTPEQMIAPLDGISRILLAYHGSKIVGSVALAFPDQSVVLDTERAFPEGYPKELPSKSSVIEVARLCTSSDYRRGDLLLRIFEHIYRVFALSDRDYLLSSTDEKLWPIYKKIGFAKTGHTYEHPYLKGINHSLILVNKKLGTHGKGIDPLRWNYLYRKMTDFVLVRKEIQYSTWDKLKIIAFRIVGRVLGVGRNERY